MFQHVGEGLVTTVVGSYPDLAYRKLEAMVAGARLVREELGS